jgi:hypothetical protein
MTNYEPPIEISIFDFQNLNFRFLEFSEKYFLKIQSHSVLDSYHILHATNHSYISHAISEMYDAQIDLPKFTGLDYGYNADIGAIGLMIVPAYLNRSEREFLRDLRLRLASRSQDLLGVLDVDIYMMYIRREAFRFWDSLTFDLRMTLLSDCGLDADNLHVYAEMDSQTLLKASAESFYSSTAAHECFVIIAHITKITLEVHRYAGIRR